jgi:hypothetical protein
MVRIVGTIALEAGSERVMLSMVKPITEYIRACRSCSAEEFVSRHDHGFLMHSALTQGAMQPVSGDRGRHTIDMLMVEPDRLPTVPSGSPLERLYKVSELKVPVGATDLVIGRSEECDIQLNDRSVSRKHARIEVRGNEYYVSDCDSSAGTFVNGLQIEEGESVKLSTGDAVGFGYLSMVFLAPAEFYRFIQDLFGG